MATQLPWSSNWGRSYKVTIGVHEYDAGGKVIEGGYKKVPTSIAIPYSDLPKTPSNIIPSKAVFLDNLTDTRGFTFTFETQQMASTKGEASEKSNLTLYNLSSEVVDILNTPNCICIIEAGYEGKTTLCYTGNVVSVLPIRNPPDTTYKVQLTSAGTAIRNTMINTHYDEDMSTKEVVLDMARRFPATAVTTYGLDSQTDRYKTGGRGFTGSLIDNFSKLAREQGLEYIFTNEKIAIIPFKFTSKDKETFLTTNYTLSEGSIKNISRVSDNTKVGNEDIKSKVKKLQINTYYIPVEVGQVITIPKTNEYLGTYIVKGRRVILQSKGNAWDVVLNVEEILI